MRLTHLLPAIALLAFAPAMAHAQASKPQAAAPAPTQPADLQQIVALGVRGVLPYLKSVGLYNTKARNLIGLCQQLIAQHGGEVPDTREAPEALPGVGRKTASVILNMVHGKLEIAVDTHIFRVANRTGLAPGKNPRAVEAALLTNVPREYLKDAHHWLLLHGRYVCTARRPDCPHCVLEDLCEYPDKTPAQKAAPAAAPGRASLASAIASIDRPRIPPGKAHVRRR